MIEARGLTKIYKGAIDVYALDNIDVTIQQGEFLSIIGPSGSGKSTFMNILSLLDTPSKGSLKINEEETKNWDEIKKSDFRNKNIGFIFQAHLLLPEFSAFENIMMPAIIGNTKTKEKEDLALNLLNEVGLIGKKDSFPNQMSGGQNQRVAIVRALVNSPKIVFADEPTGALDQKNTLEIFNIFKKLNQELNTTFIIVTHEKDLAQKTNRIIEIIDGKIV